jgi:site-specific recombinase XerD
MNMTTITQTTGDLAYYLDQAKSPNTVRAYKADWADFEAFCKPRQLNTLPADAGTVAQYIAKLAKRGLKASTIGRRLVALDQVHRRRGFDAPSETSMVRFVFGGIQRDLGTKPEPKAPLLVDELERLLAILPANLLGLRDKALLLLGFAGAFRRSELVAIDIEHLERHDQGLVVHLGRTKTDPEGRGRKVGIPYGKNPERCPVLVLRAWVKAAGFRSGALFRPVNKHGQVVDRRLDDRAVAKIVQRTAKAAGLDPKRYAGHSLRSGFCTSAALAGANDRAIMKQTGHTSLQTVQRYIQDAQLFQGNAAALVL